MQNTFKGRQFIYKRETERERESIVGYRKTDEEWSGGGVNASLFGTLHHTIVVFCFSLLAPPLGAISLYYMNAWRTAAAGGEDRMMPMG